MGADVLFTSGRAAYLQLYDGTSTYNIKCLAGTQYSLGDNDVIIDGAQGSSIAAPSAALTGMFTPRLDVVCNVWPWTSGSPDAGWYNAAFIKWALGVSSGNDLATRGVANCNTFRMKFVNGDPTTSAILDTVKLAAISFEAAPGGAILCRMTFLGTGDTTAWPGEAYADSTGSPLYWKNISAVSITPQGGANTSIAPTVQGLSWGYSTGAGYGKVADATDYPSLVDVLTVLGASMSVDQRAGADVRAFSNRNVTFGWTLGAVAFTMQCNRQGRAYPMNPSGMLVDRTNWQLFWHTVASAAAGCT